MKIAVNSVFFADNKLSEEAPVESEQDRIEKALETGYESNEYIQDLMAAVDKELRRVPTHLLEYGYKLNIVDLRVSDYRLYYKDRLTVPDNKETRLQILQSFHDTQLAGHPRSRVIYY